MRSIDDSHSRSGASRNINIAKNDFDFSADGAVVLTLSSNIRAGKPDYCKISKLSIVGNPVLKHPVKVLRSLFGMFSIFSDTFIPMAPSTLSPRVHSPKTCNWITCKLFHKT